MKKFILTCFLTLFSVVTWAYDFTDNSTGSTIFYNIVNDCAEVTWGGTGAQKGTPEYTGAITVPATVTHSGTTYTVIGLGDDAFDTCTGLTSISLPNTITYMNIYAFYGDTGLTEIDIPKSVTTIGQSVFDNCSNLTSVVVPDGVTELGMQVFNKCSALTEVTLGTNIAYLGRNTFNACDNIEKMTIYNSTPPQWNGTASPFSTMSKAVLYVPNGSKRAYQAFSSSYGTYTQYFKSIEEFDPNTPLTEGEQFSLDGFYYTCVSSENQTIEVTWGGPTNTSGTDTYTGDITIPSEAAYHGYTYTVIGIGDSAFRQCEGLTKVVIPNTVTYIGGTYVFSECSSLTSVTIPESVTYIGDETFYNCEALEEITLPNSVKTLGAYAFWTCSNLTKVTLPEALTEIGQYTFYKCSALADCTLPQTLTTIGKNAFYQCDALEEVSLPDALTSIGDYAYYKCVGLKKVTLSKNITTWDKYVFQGCTMLSDVTFPEGLVALGDYAFSNCSALESVEFNSDLTSLGDNGFANSGLKEVEIPASVGEINSKAFYNCEQLTTVTMHDGTTSIGESAFYNDSMVVALTIPASVTTTGNSAFYGMTKLSSLKFEEGSKLATMGSNTFYRCAALKDVTLPNSLTSMGSSTFYYCSGLETVTLSENIEELTTNTFCYCTSLKEVVVPEKVTIIDNYAFDGCTSLTKVTIPEKVTELKNKVFQNCEKLASVTCYNPEPATCGTQVFDGIYEECILYVPLDSKQAYEEADTWKDFYAIVEMVPLSLVTLDATNVTDSSATLSGSVSPSYNEPILECGFEYWADDSDVQTIASEATEDGEFSVAVDELMYGTIYTYRAYATTESGTNYGEALTFTTEIYAPKVATLAATDATNSSAVLNGEVEQGSEPISQKGFIYWENNSPNEMTTINVSEEEFAYTLEGLEGLTAYTYRAFVRTDSGTVYGDDVEFTTTAVPDGINGIRTSLDDENVEGIYSTSGQRLNSTMKGVNIIRFNDGTVKKIYVK